MRLDDLAGNGQAKTEPAMLARKPAVGLAEPLEEVRQEIGRDAAAGVADDDCDLAAGVLQPHLQLAAASA